MKLSLLFLILTSFSAWSTEDYKSLSCSKSDRGTQIYYINGVFTGEFGAGSAEETAVTIAEYIDDLGKKKIDANGKVFVESVYNTSEPLAADIVQTIFQKIQETGEVPSAKKIGKFIFRNYKYCLTTPVLCGSIALSIGRLLSVQSYISGSDLNVMASLVSQQLRDDYKVIVVSHSQGNIYSNLLYERVLKFGIEQTILDKFYGNLQVASAASSVNAKNFRLITSNQDKVINGLRDKFPTTLKSNFILSGNPETMDGFKHTMALSYLSPTIQLKGLKQGFGIVTRSAKGVFLDSLEELSWMLANNDSNCCNGRDGRFHRNDYISPPDGFLESSVYVDPRLNLQIESKQVCGAVEFRSYKKGDKIVVDRDSSIDAIGPIVLKGSVYLKNSRLNNSSPEPQVVSNQSPVPMIVEGGNISGNASVDGPLYLLSGIIEGPSKVKGTLYVSPSDLTSSFAPFVLSSRISGQSETSGNFMLIYNDLVDSKIRGGVTSFGANLWRNTFVGFNSSRTFNNVTIEGNVFAAGVVEPGSTLSGYLVDGNANGIIINEQAKVKANSTISGTALIDRFSEYAGNWTGDIDSLGRSGYLLSGNVNANISGAPRIFNHFIGSEENSQTNSSISGSPIIVASYLYGSQVSCNAKVINESGFLSTFGCGYTSETADSTDFLTPMNALVNNSYAKILEFRNLLNQYSENAYSEFSSF